MKKKKVMAILLSLCMSITLLSGCGGQSKNAASDSPKTDTGSTETAESDSSKVGGEADATAENDTANGTAGVVENLNPEGFPIVNEEITFRIFGQQGPVQAKWSEMGMWKKYQEMSNIKLDFTDVLPAEGYDEKKSLMWASNVYPDLFVRAQLTNSEIVKYGSMGILAPLEELIPVYAPNLQKLIDEYPAILSRITAPDGHIYALPAIFTVNAARCEKFWLNEAWLKEVSMEVPTTLDELEEVLRAFRGKDFNGNGQKDEYPMGAADAQTLIRRFIGSYGHQIQFGRFLEVTDGKVSSWMNSEDMKSLLIWLNKLYKEELIDPEVFTQEYAKYAAKMAGQQMGLFFNQADDTFDSTNFIGISPFGSGSSAIYAEAQPVARDNGVFAICADSENKEAAMRWIDYFYGEEGSVFLRYGVEGENMYFDADGMPRYNDGILNSPEGSGTEIGKYTIWPGGGAPQWVNDQNCEAIASTATLNAEVALNSYFPENIYADPLLDQETSDRLAILWTDLDKYQKETTAKFIRGELNFEKDWDIYVETLTKIGIEEVLSIYQEAFDKLN